MSRRGWVTLTIWIGAFMSTLDASIVNISLPTMVRSLNTDLTAVAWVVMAYLIVITLSLPASPLERAKGSPSLASLQDVWKLVVIIGLAAILISWARENKSDGSGAK